jgi:glycosyltransferase involved in cell wall biosynthesis
MEYFDAKTGKRITPETNAEAKSLVASGKARVVMTWRETRMLALRAKGSVRMPLPKSVPQPSPKSILKRAILASAHPLPADEPCLRVALIHKVFNHYSGGRIYLYQVARALASNGADVWICSDEAPMWANDYPGFRPQWVNSPNRLPDDIDVVIGDGKNEWGRKALAAARDRNVPFMPFVFEVPAFIRQTDEGYAELHERNEDLSPIGKAHAVACLERLGMEAARTLFPDVPKWAVLAPSVNQAALESALASPNPRPDRRYVCASARPAKNKHWNSIVKAVMNFPGQLDLVAFTCGGGRRKLRGFADHEVVSFNAAPEAEKLAWFRHAEAVLAPSSFEGYGMVPAEAVSVGTPCAVYDLPVLRNAYGDALEYAPLGNEAAFCDTVKRIVETGKRPDAATVETVRAKHSWAAMETAVDRLPYLAVKRKRVSAHMLAWAGAGLHKFAIESVYPYADEILVAAGPCPEAVEAGWGDDGTVDAIESMPDPDGKIKVWRRDVWPDKKVMRQFLLDNMEGNYLIVLDGDEIWTGVEHLLASPDSAQEVRWVNLWHGPRHWIWDAPDRNDRRWGKRLAKYPVGSQCFHFRAANWRYSYRWYSHSVPTTTPKKDTLERSQKPCYDTVVWHFGHSLPRAIMEPKLRFYQLRDGGSGEKGDALQRRADAWLNWNGGLGDCGDGIVGKVEGELPALVKRAFAHLGVQCQPAKRRNLYAEIPCPA